MKKSLFALAIVFILMTLEACSLTKFVGNRTFDGSRTGNKSQLIMEYNILNTTDTQMLEFQKDDIVDFKITSKSGNLSIVLQKEGDEPIYKGVDIPTSSFQVEIEETGTYKVFVTGKKAKGSVSIQKVDKEAL